MNTACFSLPRHAPRAAALVLAAILLGPGAAAGVVINKILGTIDGEPITLHQLREFAAHNVHGRQLSGADQAGLLDALVMDLLVDREVSAKGIVVQDEDVDRYIEGIKERNNLDDRKLTEALKQQGMTMESYRTQVRQDIQRQQLISREIRGKVSVTPEDVQRYYEAHPSEDSSAGTMQVAHILFRLSPDATPDQVVAATAKAQQALERVRGGTDFGEVARQVSEDPSAESGGSLGSFQPGQLLEPIERAVGAMEVGEVSEPVRTKLGVHLVKLEGRSGPGETHSAAESEKVREQLYAAALEERFQKWMKEDLRQRHHVELFE